MENVLKSHFEQGGIRRAIQENQAEQQKSQKEKALFRGHTASITKPAVVEGTVFSSQC